MIKLMSMVLYPLAVLFATFLILVLVDRGAPNTLESIAFFIERHARWIVSALRSNAARLRSRQREIEQENRARLSETAALH
jgi:hypothetical protein